MQLVRGPLVIGEEQQPEQDLRDDQRLRERDQVRGATVRAACRRAPDQGTDLAATQAAITSTALAWWTASIDIAPYREERTWSKKASPPLISSFRATPARRSSCRRCAASRSSSTSTPRTTRPGCTTQACAIRDAWGEFQGAGAVVLGVSPDDVASHVKFKSDYDLPFTLLADTDHAVAEAYGVWAEKSRYGRTYMGIVRSTFVIGADGNVMKIMANVQPATHAADVLAVLGRPRRANTQ